MVALVEGHPLSWLVVLCFVLLVNLTQFGVIQEEGD